MVAGQASLPFDFETLERNSAASNSSTRSVQFAPARLSLSPSCNSSRSRNLRSSSPAQSPRATSPYSHPQPPTLPSLSGPQRPPLVTLRFASLSSNSPRPPPPLVTPSTKQEQQLPRFTTTPTSSPSLPSRHTHTSEVPSPLTPTLLSWRRLQELSRLCKSSFSSCQ